MPIYEYQCAACGHQLEAIQKFSDEPMKICPECRKPELRKLVSSSAFHLKGGGWYVTDIRDKDKKKPETKDAAASSDNAASPAPESKPETKTGGSSSNTNDSSAG
jgi:putative FmdB family regulatory protein